MVKSPVRAIFSLVRDSPRLLTTLSQTRAKASVRLASETQTEPRALKLGFSVWATLYCAAVPLLSLDYTLRHSFRIGTRLPEPCWEAAEDVIAGRNGFYALTLFVVFSLRSNKSDCFVHQANANVALQGLNLIMKLVADCPLSQRGSSLIGLLATKEPPFVRELPRPSLAPVTRARRVWVSEATVRSTSDITLHS